MASRRPHKRMKMGRRRVVLSIVRGSHPSPPLLDSGLRRNDDWGAGLTKGCREWRMRGCRSGLSRILVQDMLS